MSQNTNFGKDLLTYSEEELRRSVNNWNPQFGALAINEMTRRQLVRLDESIQKLNETIDRSSEENEALERSNYRLQVAMLALTGVTTAVAIFPLLTTSFRYLASHLSAVGQSPLISILTSNLFVAATAAAFGLLTTFITNRIGLKSDRRKR